MSTSDKVRFSRDGDQFHYLWAARRCLRLLSSTSGLIAVSIEGTSTREAVQGTSIDASEELIDVGEYYGSEEVEKTTLIRYLQLKHSTQNPTVAWPASGLEKTLRGFAERYQALEARFGVGTLNGRVEFGFVSNRPMSPDFMEAIEDAASEVSGRHPKDLKKLEDFTSLTGEKLSAFCRLLRLEGGHEGYWLQRAALAQETKAYLPGDDVDAPVQLKELVTRKALSENENNRSITKIDVLRALGTTEERIFPAPSRIASLAKSIPRAQEAELVAKIISADAPIILHAAGGVGKSVFSQRIKLHLPTGSVVVVYDCFGNGEYRRIGSPRHRHKDALVQIANELATLGLCDPLIPSSNADNTDYLKASAHRVKQGIAAIKAQNEQALLCLAIDAADNAEMAAKEFGGERSFARDLLREALPDGLRLVVLCRTERQDLLDPPASVLRLELQPFSRDETATFLREAFSDASENDVDEFHRLTSHNPRVQATALAQSDPLAKILRSLGPNPTTVDATIAALLERAIDELRERVGITEKSQIDAICAGLAVLRPLVPVSVLASVSGVQASTIRSFAADLGRPLLMMGDAIQFRDEPVETWFREHFRPRAEQLSAFIAALQPLASTSAYVASTLPQLMLESGQLSELVELALSSSSLPTASPIEKRDIELQRLQFALKASLRAKRFVEAAKLALKAGEEMAGDARQQKLLQNNTDLVAALIAPERIQEIVSRRTFGGGWVGVHHVYEAGLLSHVKDFQGDARSRLRMAYEWLANWSRLSEEEREKERIHDDDIAEITIAHFNLHGPDVCATELRRWIPREVSFRVGRVIAQRLVDHGRYDDLDRLAINATNNLCLLLAINLELRVVHRSPPKETVERALRLILNNRVKIKGRDFDYKETVLQAITALVESAYAYRLRDNNVLASALQRYLPNEPPRGWASRYSSQRSPLLRAYTLRAALKGESLQSVDLAHPELRDQLENKRSYNDSRDLQEFKAAIGALLPWHTLWAENFLAPKGPSVLTAEIARVRQESARAASIGYRDESFTSDEVADIWFDILIANGGNDEALLQEFKTWAENFKRPLFIPTWTRLARLAARIPQLQSHAYRFAQRAFELTRNAKDIEAESKAETYIELARAILSMDKTEAGEYLNRAIEVVSKLGDEILDRWQAILNLADRAADVIRPVPQAAYRLARCAEVAEVYNTKHFDWAGTTTAIAGLCPSSSLAILSRWRDRGFGRSEGLIAIAAHHLVAQQRIDPKAALALVGFREQWKYCDLLKNAFDVRASHPERGKMLNFVLRYMRLQGQSSTVWEELETIATASALNVPDIDQLIEFAHRRKASRSQEKNSDSYGGSHIKPNREKDWDAIFLNLDLHTANGLSNAYANFRNNDPPFYHERFFAELFQRVPPGKAADLVRVFAESAEFSLYSFYDFLEQLPDAWKSRMAIKSALADAIRGIFRRYCMEITKGRYYQPLSPPKAAELSGISELELIDVVLTAIGETTEVIGSSRLFTLVGLLASKLSHDEALEALNFGLDLFDDVLDEKDGDGPWTAALEPPSDINAAVAGYIWGALAAPEASLRWEAAHVVRGLCALGGQAILGHLIELAQSRSGGSFADARLHFYYLHARQWLLIALARATMENPDAIIAHVNFLIHFALKDEPHVLIRHFAAKAALALANGGHLKIDANEVARLTAVNRSFLPVISSNRYQRGNRDKKENRETKHFNFNLDIDRYWFDSLGDCFAVMPPDIASEAEKVICEDWRVSENGNWDNDERNRRGLYRDHESWHSHGSYPRTDDLSFYLSYHAIMVVAGKLLATVPLHQDPDEPGDEFRSWLRRHTLSRQDDCWLSDRRDPIPLEWPNWKDEKQEDHWRWSVRRSDFERLLGIREERLNLWGSWTTISGRQEEAVRINSALVTPNRSAALLRALQTASNPHDYCIPDAGNELEIDEVGFQLKGWVEDEGRDSELDQFDPWAGDIRYPPPKPAKFARDLFQLKSGGELRVWQLQVEGALKEVLWSQVWGRYRREDDESEGEHGRRLQVSRVFIAKFLDKMNMDLIVKVEIERRISRYRYERNKDDGLGYVQPYFRIFLIRADGHSYSL